MARDKANQNNIDGSDLIAYPNKRIRDNDGSGNGTPVDESIYGDIHEFMAKLMRDANINYNGLPDNNINGYQLYDSLMSLAGKNSLIKNISVLNPTTLNVPIKLNVLKIDETLIFKSTLISNTNFNQIKGTDNITKSLLISGQFISSDYIRLINTGTQIILTGLYDSTNVPNLVQRLTDIEVAINPMIQKLAIFTVGGVMFIWNKSVIPTGFQEVTDFKGKTIFGMDTSQTEFAVLGAFSGNKNKSLSITEMPAHKHTVPVFANGSATGAADGHPDNYIDYNRRVDSSIVGGPAGTTTEGPGQSFSLLNPYGVVKFIEWATV